MVVVVGGPAAYYTGAHAACDYLEIDQNRFVHQAGLSGCINQFLAGGTTGLLYKSMGESRLLRFVRV